MIIFMFTLLSHYAYPEEIFQKQVSLVSLYPYFFLKANPLYPHISVLFFEHCKKTQIKKKKRTFVNHSTKEVWVVFRFSVTQSPENRMQNRVSTILLL